MTQLLVIQLRKLGARHPDTLRALDNLAAEYLRRGDTARAETMLTATVEGRRSVLGAEERSQH